MNKLINVSSHLYIFWLNFNKANYSFLHPFRLGGFLGYKSKSNVLHYKNLQLYLSLGIKLVKVRKILKFKQSYWLILIQTKEKNAAYSFEKDFLKLISNGTFDKAMENVRKRINVRLVNNAGDYKKYASQPSFVSQRIFSKHFNAIHEIKAVLTLEKPIYVGFSILDLNKLLMYEFLYKYIKTKYNTRLLFTETDKFSLWN